MAVEIPVVVDIDKGFAEAAKRVPVAMKPLKDSIEKLTADLTLWQENMSRYKIDSPQWKNAAKQIQLISQALEVANDRLMKYTSNDGSIRRMSAELASLNRRWEEMGAAQKYDKKGNLSSDAKKLWDEYKRITVELEKQGRSLAQMEAEEKRIADIEKRRQELTDQGTQKRRYENAILNSNVKTLRVLQEQERILTSQLNQATIGSDKYKKLQEKLRDVQTEMRNAQGVVLETTNVFQKQAGVLTGLSNTFASYISIYSLLRFAKQIRDVTGELEYQRVALGHLIQDEEYGATLFERIKEKAIESPFRIKDLVTYTKQLAAFRIEQEELYGTMTRLADISAGLGVDMDRLILAYGQVRAASVLRGQELRQFTEAGIPLVDMLAEKFTELNGRMVKTSEVFELISKRAVPFSMISDIFEDLTDKGGMFYKMQEQQAETLKGQWEKLKDAFDIGLQTIGETKTFERYNSIILKTLNILARNLYLVPKAIEAAGAAWLVYTIATTKARIATRKAAAAEIEEIVAQEAQSIAKIRGIKHVDAYTKALIRQRLATNALSKGFWKLWAAIVASPVGAILSAVGAVAAGFFLWKKRTDEVVNSFEELDEIIEQTSSGLKDTEKIDKMIDRYERLATKTDRTVKENNRLYQTMTQLQEAFPEITVGIDNETESLEAQIEKMREANKLREDEIRLRAETELGSQQVKLEKAEKERNRKYKERLGYIQTAARLERELAVNNLYLDSQEWKKAKERAGEISEELTKQDKTIDGIQRRVAALNRILYGETQETLNAWQKQIQSMRDVVVADVTSPLFTDEDIEGWETLDVALEAVSKAKKKAQEQEDSLAESIKSQTGDIRKQIEAELEWARATRIVAESIEEFFKSPTIFARDIMTNFSELLEKTYDEGAIKQFGEMMKNEFSTANVDLLSRPLVDAADLIAKGWENAGDGIATVFSSLYDFEDKDGNAHNILVTPILPDGTILSPEELDKYVNDIVGRASSTLDIIKNGKAGSEIPIILGFDVDENAGERLHEMQEEYYHLLKMRNDLPEQFLITQKDLIGLREATDVTDLVEKKISDIEKELDSIEKISIENLDHDEIEKTENYRDNLEEIYDWLLKLRARFLSTADEYPDIANDIIENFEDVLGRKMNGGKGMIIPVDFMLSDKDLQGLYNVGDLFDLLDNKISGIEKEIEKVNATKITEGVSEEVIENAELYILNLEHVRDLLLQIQGRYRDQMTDIAKDVEQAYPELMADAYRKANKSSIATQGLFSNEELRRIGTIVDLYDMWSSKLQAVQKAKEQFNKQFSTAIDEQTRENAKAAINSLNEQERMLLDFMVRYGFLLPTKTTGGASEQDPWVLIYKNRMKFMQDFRKGVEDLDQYMAHSDALAKQREIMEGRGAALGFDVKTLSGSREELLAWYDETIEKIKNEISKLGGKTWSGLGVQAILAKDTKSRTLKAWQDLLADVFKERTDFDLSQTKKDLEDALQRLSDEIKRSETARNFYKNILDMTGDEELAANMTVSVYGDVGKEFKDRMQQQLDAAFQSLDWSELPDDVFGQLAVAVSNQDFNAILDKLELFPEEWQKVLKQMASDNEKYNADYLSNLYKTYQKAKDFDERRRDVRNREAQKRAEIEANTSLTDEQKAEFTAASRTKEAKDLAKINVEELKNTYEWTKAFEDLDRVGSVTLVNLREKIEAIIEAQKDILTPEDLKALTEALTKIRDTQTKRDPITAFASSGRKAALLAPAVFSKQGSKAYDKAIEKIKKFNEQAKETDKIDLDHLQDAFTASVDDIEKGAEAVANYASQWKGVIDTISDVFELDEIPILGETIDGVSSALGVVAAIIPVITVETTALSAAANSIPFVAILTAIVATLGAIIGMIKGIINAKVERLNQKIETQKEYVNDLERAYDRLGKAIEKSFGTDYIENYRKSLENLAAQQAAYQEQARLEREKGKKKDEKKAREYEEAAVDVTEKIEDAQGQIAEFFAGTDLTSAAKDFASAWLDAYREFGSITTAMKEKFQDMLGNMVENAMFAQLAQTILRPFYDEINRRADDGQLSAKDVADIASMVPDYIESLNGAFTVAANQLQAYGYNLRETAGTMTGISRSIAGASEESINGLAAGINTQNFYMQHIDANVALILSSLTGGTTTAGASVTGEVVDPYKDVVLKNVSFIPSIDRNLSELLAEVRKVIKPRDAARSSSHVLVTNL